MRMIKLGLAISLGFTSTLAMARPLQSDTDIQRALAGNTVSGENDKEPYTEFLRPDGVLVGMEKSGEYTGHWRVWRAHVCFSYDDDHDKPGPWECAKVDLEGSSVTWTTDDGDNTVATLQSGNPHRL